MKFNFITFAILLILANFTLLFLPEALLLNWAYGLSAVIFLLILWIGFRRKWLLMGAFTLLALCYMHDGAIQLLQLAKSVQPEKKTLSFEVVEVLHQQDYQTLVVKIALAENRPPQRIFINWRGKETPQLGEIWQGEVTLRPLSARLNFGGFDRQQWYLAKGITATGNIKSAVKMGENLSWRAEKLQQVLKQTGDLSLRGLLIALAFGERAWLDKHTWTIYQQTNTAHLIAISGLHIGLAMGIGVVLARIGQGLFPTRRITPFVPLLVGVIFALIYAYLAGFTVPTFRAIIALCFVSLVQVSRFYYTPFQLFTLVVAFLLLCDPLMSLSASFWLSVGAVFCLIVWYRYVPFRLFQWRHKPFSPKVRWLLALIHLQFGLLLLFTPLQLFLFNGTALNGFVANLFSVPLYSFILVPLILFAVLTNGAFYSWQLANTLSEWITDLIAMFQHNWLVISTNTAIVITAFCILLFSTGVLWIYRKPKVSEENWQMKPARFFTLEISQVPPHSQLKQLKWSACLVLLFCFSALSVKKIKEADWQLDTLDIGQGLATLIVKKGKAVLFDTGASWQGGSMAALEILPYLQREGILLEKLILSHDDNDHSGGAKAILHAFPQIELITPSLVAYDEDMARDPHLRSVCQAGRSWQWQGLRFQMLSPKEVVARADNPNSCVILLLSEHHKVLLTGDADVATERKIAADIGKIDVLQVGHHGSKTSTSETLIAQTKPDIALISSSRWNPWKFPHPSVVERLTRYQSHVFNTATSGQIRLRFNQKQLEISTARSLFSPWYGGVIGFSSE